MDCTLGGGGHARIILEHITPGGRLIGIDRDKDALDKASENLKRFKDNIVLIQSNFKDLKSALEKKGIGEVDGILFDLGLSSLQLEDEERGFSIKRNGPLDMRMDRALGIDAGHLVNSLSEHDLASILREYGQERFWRRIAKMIVSKRPIETTFKLAEIVTNATPARFRHGRIHPATRTFQALRIAVNGELDALRSVLDIVPSYIKKSGRLCVISFHSLEDRIVKHKFREFKAAGLFEILTKKPIVPEREEVLMNARSRSAKLRVAERL